MIFFFGFARALYIPMEHIALAEDHRARTGKENTPRSPAHGYAAHMVLWTGFSSWSTDIYLHASCKEFLDFCAPWKFILQQERGIKIVTKIDLPLFWKRAVWDVSWIECRMRMQREGTDTCAFCAIRDAERVWTREERKESSLG